MSINRERPHLYVLPEGDANRQLANGFFNIPQITVRNRFQVLPPCKGWMKTVEKFRAEYIRELRKYSKGRLFMLVDFDEDEGRLDYIVNEIPAELGDRVFVVGTWSNPESLRRALNKDFESIGAALARECVENRWDDWNHEQLQFN